MSLNADHNIGFPFALDCALISFDAQLLVVVIERCDVQQSLAEEQDWASHAIEDVDSGAFTLVVPSLPTSSLLNSSLIITSSLLNPYLIITYSVLSYNRPLLLYPLRLSSRLTPSLLL